MTPVEHIKPDGIIRVYESGWQVFDSSKRLIFFRTYRPGHADMLTYDPFATSRLAGSCDACDEFLCHMAGREPLAGEPPKPPPAADSGGICHEG